MIRCECVCVRFEKVYVQEIKVKSEWNWPHRVIAQNVDSIWCLRVQLYLRTCWMKELRRINYHFYHYPVYWIIEVAALFHFIARLIFDLWKTKPKKRVFQPLILLLCRLHRGCFFCVCACMLRLFCFSRILDLISSNWPVHVCFEVVEQHFNESQSIRFDTNGSSLSHSLTKSPMIMLFQVYFIHTSRPYICSLDVCKCTLTSLHLTFHHSIKRCAFDMIRGCNCCYYYFVSMSANVET